MATLLNQLSFLFKISFWVSTVSNNYDHIIIVKWCNGISSFDWCASLDIAFLSLLCIARIAELPSGDRKHK